MAQKKKATVKKIKQKQNVNVNVVVNSNNRRKVVAHPKAQQPQPVYIPSSSQSTPTIVLREHSQPHPATNTDVASHIENAMKRLVPSQTLATIAKEPEKKLIETAKEIIPVHVAIKKEEHILTPVPIKHEGLLEPKYVSAKSESPSDSDYLSTRTRKAKFLSDSESNSDVPSLGTVRRLFATPEPPRSIHVQQGQLLRGQNLLTEAAQNEVGTQTVAIRRNRAGQASLVQFFNAHEIPIENTNISAMKGVLKEKGLLDDYYQKPKRN